MTAFVPTTAPLKNGIVRLVRSSPELRTALTGGIHERVAPRRLRYPFFVFSEVSAPFIYEWGGGDSAFAGVLTIKALFDLSVLALNKVEAQNLDQLVAALFSSSNAAEDLDALTVGQRVYVCRRVANMPTGPDSDDEGRRIVQFGGTYEIWTDQKIPA